MRGDDLGGQLLHCMSDDTSFRCDSFEMACCVQESFRIRLCNQVNGLRLIAPLHRSALAMRLSHGADRARVVSPQVFDARCERRFSCTRSMELVGCGVELHVHDAAPRFTFTSTPISSSRSKLESLMGSFHRSRLTAWMQGERSWR